MSARISVPKRSYAPPRFCVSPVVSASDSCYAYVLMARELHVVSLRTGTAVAKISVPSVVPDAPGAALAVNSSQTHIVLAHPSAPSVLFFKIPDTLSQSQHHHS